MRIRVSLLANLSGQVWTAGLNLAAVPFYIQFLGVDAFGLIGLFTVVLIIVSLLDAGLTTTLNREMVCFVAGERCVDSIRDLLRSVEVVFGIAAAGLIPAAVILGPLLAKIWIGPSTIPTAVVSFSLTMMITASVLRVVEALYRAALLGLHRPVLMNGLSAASSTLRIAGVIGAFMLAGANLRTFFVWQVAIGVLTLTAYIIATHRAIGLGSRRARFDPAQLQDIRGFASGAFAVSALGIALTQADKIIVPRLVSLREVGYYSTAFVIATGINQIVLPIFNTFYPRFSLLHATAKEEEFEATYLRAARLTAVVVGCPAAVLIGFSHEILFAWIGQADVVDAAAPLLQRMAPGALAFGLFHLPMAALLAAGTQQLAVRVMALALLLLVPAILAGFALAGLDGIAVGWSAILCLMLVLVLFDVRRSVLPRSGPLTVFGQTLSPVIVALAVAGLMQWVLISTGGGRLLIAAELTFAGVAVLTITALATWHRNIKWTKVS